ncbi:MAG: hypothetical protein ABI723_07000 [Bacteroidia bacterium]
MRKQLIFKNIFVFEKMQKTFVRFKYLLLPLCLLFNIQILFGQKDSLKVTDISYTSDFEKKYFDEYMNQHKANAPALLLSTNPVSTDFKLNEANMALDKYFNDNELKINSEKNQLKKYKFIFNSVHDKFFKKYKEDASFDKIFSSGEYNCLTATAVYAMVLDHLSIPYTIKEEPTHVYLVADPNRNSMLFEATNPTLKYYNPDDKFKKNYIDYLLESKVTTREELNTKGYDEIFNTNYYSKDNITLQQLVGLHYYNDGVSFLNDKEYKKAYKQFEKAYLLYPSQRIAYLLKVALTLDFANLDYSTLDQIDQYLKFYNYCDKEKLRENLLSDFSAITKRFLIEKDNKKYYDQVYSKFREKVSDTIAIKEISTEYYYENARAFALKNNIDSGLEYIVQAYCMDTVNLNVKGLLSSILSEKMNKHLSPENNTKLLDDYCSRFPQLKETAIFRNLYVRNYLYASALAFDSDNRTKGMQNLKKFEEMLSKNNIDIDNRMIGTTYGLASSSYLRLNDQKTGKDLLLRGLKIVPDNEELKRKLKLLNDAFKK